jgi:hypothetical protein
MMSGASKRCAVTFGHFNSWMTEPPSGSLSEGPCVGGPPDGEASVKMIPARSETRPVVEA